ncbi:MAG: O-antigen ligase family protein [Verrucomicrobiota bacterium]
MPIVSSIFWIAGFILSALMGPTLEIWTWGPSMLCFAAATAFAIPNIWREGIGKFSPYILITGLASAAWMAGRAWFSPAEELALMDLSLVAMAVSTFIVLQNAFQNSRAQMIIIIGIALLLGTNLVLMAVQTRDITYTLLIPHGTHVWPAGIFRHYSHCAAFLIGSSLLLGGFSLKSSWPLIARTGLLLLALTGLAAIFLTKSRSGMIGASGGVFTLVIYWILTSKRDDRKWSGVALVLAPIVMIGIAAIALSTLEAVQQTRREGSSLIDMMDNDIRLYLYGLALSCIMLHPFMGGGSRSFSWENYQFWKIDEIGGFGANPEHVHNEFVQVFTDYGIIGAVFLTAFFVGIWILCTFRSLAQGEWAKYPHGDAWRIGGIAAFLGIFIQSNFEGILRTAPGAIMLAACLAAASHERIHQYSLSVKYLWPRRISLTAFSLAAICLLGFYGWKGSMVSKELWSTVFEKYPVPAEKKIEAYTGALAHWKLESLLSQRGILRYELASAKSDKKQSDELLELAIQDSKQAALLHPYTPLHPRNTANALSRLTRFNEATAYYEKAIELQGGMEAGFKSRFQFANHLLQVGLKELYTGSIPLAIEHFTRASALLETFPEYFYGASYYALQKNLTLKLAQAFEDQEQFQLALEKYDQASRVHLDPDAGYLAGTMLMGIAETALSDQRPRDALRLFLEAEKRITPSSSISPEARDTILAELRKKIVGLEQTQHHPAEEIRFK